MTMTYCQLASSIQHHASYLLSPTPHHNYIVMQLNVITIIIAKNIVLSFVIPPSLYIAIQQIAFFALRQKVKLFKTCQYSLV